MNIFAPAKYMRRLAEGGAGLSQLALQAHTRVVVLLAAALLFACHRPAEHAPTDATRHHHANGLVVRAGPQWRASAFADGLRFEPAEGNAGRREAVEVTVQVSNAPPAVSVLPMRERIGQRELAYGVERLAGGGSGGDEYVLIAVEPWGRRYLLWRQVKQSELGEPEFELWTLARGLDAP